VTDGGELDQQDKFPIQATNLRNMDTGPPLNTYKLETPKYYRSKRERASELTHKSTREKELKIKQKEHKAHPVI